MRLPWLPIAAVSVLSCVVLAVVYRADIGPPTLLDIGLGAAALAAWYGVRYLRRRRASKLRRQRAAKSRGMISMPIRGYPAKSGSNHVDH